MDRRPGGWIDADEPEMVCRASLDAAESARLRDTAQRNGVTVSTLMLGVWASILAAYSGDDDVVFGIVVSNRPPELPNIDSMIGMLVNTLPLRVSVADLIPFWNWLRVLQRGQLDARDYEFTPLAQIHEWSGISRDTPLFETLVAFQNHPGTRIASGPAARSGLLSITDARWTGPTNYPLLLRVGDGVKIDFGLSYYRSRFADATVARMLEDVQTLVRRAVDQPDLGLRDVPSRLQRQLLPLAPLLTDDFSFVPIRHFAS